MTIEIRELVIKTEIKSQVCNEHVLFEHAQVKKIKQEVLNDCMRSIKKMLKKNSFNR